MAKKRFLKWLIKLKVLLRIDCKPTKEVLQKDVQNLASK